VSARTARQANLLWLACVCSGLSLGACSKAGAPNASVSASATASGAAASAESEVGIPAEALAAAGLTTQDFEPGPAPSLPSVPAAEKVAPGPGSWSDSLAALVGASPRRPVAKPVSVPDPWPECATTFARDASAKKHEVAWSARKKAAAAYFARADGLAQTHWAPVQRSFWQARRRLIDATAEGCTIDAPSAPCAPFVERLRASEALGAFSCTVKHVLRATDAPARDLVACEVDAYRFLLEIRDDARSAVLGAELAAAAERSGLAEALGAQRLDPATDRLPAAPLSPPKLRLDGLEGLVRFAPREGDAAGALEALTSSGLEPTVVVSLWGEKALWLVRPKKGSTPSVVLEQRGEPPPPPAPTPRPAREPDDDDDDDDERKPEAQGPTAPRCTGTGRWDLAACSAQSEEGSLAPWFRVAGGPGRPQIAVFPAQPGQAVGMTWPPDESARVLAFRREVISRGGFGAFTCSLADANLATDSDHPFDERTLALARRAGVPEGELVEWRLSCLTGEDAGGGLVVLHVPSYDLWADATLGVDGYSVKEYHAVRGGHFAGPLRAIAEAGLLNLPRGAKLEVSGYASLRRASSGEWHVGFASSCPESGLPCEFRDGRGSPTITSVAMEACDVSGFAYPR